MTQSGGSFSSLALSSRRPGNAARAVPKTLKDRRAVGMTDKSVPAQPAEIAQARVFEALLQAERAELLDLASRTGRGIDQMPDSDGSQPVQQRTEIRARLNEVHRLLHALRGRFPLGTTELDR
jgi:hypothetical protein